MIGFSNSIYSVCFILGGGYSNAGCKAPILTLRYLVFHNQVFVRHFIKVLAGVEGVY